MKLLLDQGLPRSAVQRLADMGISAEHVGEVGMAHGRCGHSRSGPRPAGRRGHSRRRLPRTARGIRCDRPVGRPHPHRTIERGTACSDTRAGVDGCRRRTRSWGRRFRYPTSNSRAVTSDWPIARRLPRIARILAETKRLGKPDIQPLRKLGSEKWVRIKRGVTPACTIRR